MDGKVDKVIADGKKARAEKTQGRHSKLDEAAAIAAESSLKSAKEKVDIIDSIDVSLPETRVPNGKMMVEIEDLSFSYESNQTPIINHFNFSLYGPDRVAISGDNGSGKTTPNQFDNRRTKSYFWRNSGWY